MAAEQFRQLVDGDAPTTPTLMSESGTPDAWQRLRAQPDSDLTQPILPADSQTTHPILSPDSQTTQPIQGLTGDQPINPPPPPMPEAGAPATPPPPPEPPTPEPPAEPPAPDPAEGTTPDPAEGATPEPAEGKPADPDAPTDPDAPPDPNAHETTMVAPEAKPKLGGWDVDPERLRGFSDAVVRARSYLDAVQMKVDRMQGAELTPQLGTSPVGQQLAKKFDDRLNSTDGLREMLVEAMKRMEKFVTSAEKAAKTYEEVEQNNVDTFDNYYGVEIEMADKPAAG